MYIVIELQTSNGITSMLTYQFDNRDQAESKFHNVLSYAAVSTVEFHAVSIIDSLGAVIRNECYNHPVQPEPNEETTEE